MRTSYARRRKQGQANSFLHYSYGSGHPFPVPWRLIPANIYQILRTLHAIRLTPGLKELKDRLKAHGIRDPLNYYGLYGEDTPWITQYAHGASTPVNYVPRNVTVTGPIVISSTPAEEQDAELVAWLTGASTVLINLGSTTLYDKPRATAMVGAIAQILEARPDLHVLWKYMMDDATDATIEDYLGPVQRFIDNDRLRISRWLTVDPASLLESGLISASVHHGGANCYWETIGYVKILARFSRCRRSSGFILVNTFHLHSGTDKPTGRAYRMLCFPLGQITTTLLNWLKTLVLGSGPASSLAQCGRQRV